MQNTDQSFRDHVKMIDTLTRMRKSYEKRIEIAERDSSDPCKLYRMRKDYEVVCQKLRNAFESFKKQDKPKAKKKTAPSDCPVNCTSCKKGNKNEPEVE